MKMKIANIKTALLATLLLALPSSARAATVDNCGEFLPENLCTDQPMELIGIIANMMVGLFGALFVVMIVVSGVQMITSGDSPDRLKAAKSRLINAIVALILLISLRAIMGIFGINIA